jgi:hypothetical protein
MDVALARVGRSNTVRRDNSRGNVMAGISFIGLRVLKFSLGCKAKIWGGAAGAKKGFKGSACKGKVPPFFWLLIPPD